MTVRIRLTIGARDVERWRSETVAAPANRIQFCHGRLGPLGYNRGNLEGPDMDVSSTERFVRYWQRIHTRSRRVIRCIPADRIDWAPRVGMWTLGSLVRHLAVIERYMFIETACGRASRYTGNEQEPAAGLDHLVALYDRLHNDSVTIVSAFPDARLRERCTTPAGADLPVGAWLRAMIEHESHHRAQIYTLLGILGVPTPPLFGLTAEEVAARGLAGKPNAGKSSAPEPSAPEPSAPEPDADKPDADKPDADAKTP
jgi:uncharacterized damage-inducible protein DinB